MEISLRFIDHPILALTPNAFQAKTVLSRFVKLPGYFQAGAAASAQRSDVRLTTDKFQSLSYVLPKLL